MFAANQMRYLVDTDRLKIFIQDLTGCVQIFIAAFQLWTQQRRANGGVLPVGPGSGLNGHPPPQPSPNQQMDNPPPQEFNHSNNGNGGLPVHMQPPARGPMNQPPMTLQPPPQRNRKSTGGIGGINSPSPSHATSPPAGSPPSTSTAPPPPPPATVKSPKAKPAPPAKGGRRRNTSKSVPTPPAQSPAAAEIAVEARNAPTPPGRKRGREVDTGSGDTAASPVVIHDEPSPPKRMKTDFEQPPIPSTPESSAPHMAPGPSSVPLPHQLQQQAAFGSENVSINTEEDATKFLQDMASRFLGGGDNPDVLGLFDGLLKNYTVPPDLVGGGSSSAVGSSGLAGLGLTPEASGSSPAAIPPPTTGDSDALIDYFDFSSFGTEAAEDMPVPAESSSMKPPPTPELSSSTNTSPESNADHSEHPLQQSSTKIEDDISDPLRLGIFKEVDGGESAYWNSTAGWKWDGPMPSLDSPWAITT